MSTRTQHDECAHRRERMVHFDLRGRGLKDEAVLAAMGHVPRERFLPAELTEFAYEDHPLPIAADQTISQPYIVAAMAEAAELRPGDRVLEIGTGSGYAAAVLGEMVAQVWTIERVPALAHDAASTLASLGYDNVTVVEGDGTLGWPPAAPFDAVIVTAGGPSVPHPLLDQVAHGGRVVIPVGDEMRAQRLLRIRRSADDFTTEDLGPVRFVPLLGAQGWDEPVKAPRAVPPSPDGRPGAVGAHAWSTDESATTLIRASAQPITNIDHADLGPLLERIGDASVVLLGESSHGTSEFYRMRAHLTRALIQRKGFTAVAVEADWPDAARIDAHVRRRTPAPPAFEAFSRFPTWMWRNREMRGFVRWLAAHNATLADESRISFHGLDLYSLFTSRDVVLAYLDRVDHAAAAMARRRYGCLTPWQHDPAAYGRAVLDGSFPSCEDSVVATLLDLLEQRLRYAAADGDTFFDAAQNAGVVADAEKYYRAMYYGSSVSWNLRDQHMFDTLQKIRAHRGPGAKVVVWEHNSHVGDGSATEMGARGEQNVGMLARGELGDDAYLVGFGTDHGTVAAAAEWGGTMHRMSIRPAHRDSYERLCHDSGVPAFLLHLREPDRPDLREELSEPRLERAIGVIYRPESERTSHYFQAVLPRQFDEYLWFDETTPVTPLAAHEQLGEPDTYPFGL